MNPVHNSGIYIVAHTNTPLKQREHVSREARGLRSILEQSLIGTMFELPNAENVEKVVVEESTIEDGKAPLLVYREAAKKA